MDPKKWIFNWWIEFIVVPITQSAVTLQRIIAVNKNGIASEQKSQSTTNENRLRKVTGLATTPVPHEI